MAIPRLCHWSAKRVAAAGARGDIVSALVLVAATVACSHAPTAGFWYTDDVFALSLDARNRLARPLTSDEIEEVK